MKTTEKTLHELATALRDATIFSIEEHEKVSCGEYEFSKTTTLYNVIEVTDADGENEYTVYITWNDGFVRMHYYNSNENRFQTINFMSDDCYGNKLSTFMAVAMNLTKAMMKVKTNNQ